MEESVATKCYILNNILIKHVSATAEKKDSLFTFKALNGGRR